MLGAQRLSRGLSLLFTLAIACDPGGEIPEGEAKTASVAASSKAAGTKDKETADEEAKPAKRTRADAGASADDKASVAEPAPVQEVAKPEEPKAEPAEPKPGPQVDKEGMLNLDVELVGPIHPGMKAAEVENVLGKPESQSKARYQAATGIYAQTWEYPGKGLSLRMAAEDRKGTDKTIDGITASATCTLPLPWGLEMGSSSRADVEKIYGTNFDPDWTDERTFIAGSVYGGSEYRFKGGKINGLFIGASAE